MSQVQVRRNVQAVRAVDKLVEYRTAHYASHSEAARYFTNTPARVQFRFANPIICRLVSGHKVMSVAGSDPFDFTPGDVMFVPPGLEIDIDLSVARADAPIECDCIEIENERIDSVLGRLNETMTRGGNPVATSLDWTAFSVLRSTEADALELPNLMGLFRTERDVFSDLRIDAKIDELFLRLLQLRGSSLLVSNHTSGDSGSGTPYPGQPASPCADLGVGAGGGNLRFIGKPSVQEILRHDTRALCKQGPHR